MSLDSDVQQDGDGYWCVICGRFIAANEDGVIIHDDIHHPDTMLFDDEDNPQ